MNLGRIACVSVKDICSEGPGSAFCLGDSGTWGNDLMTWGGGDMDLGRLRSSDGFALSTQSHVCKHSPDFLDVLYGR